jgi:spore coat polysaccharide biosynthesis protein SpsF
MERAWGEAHLPSDREHVTPYIWRHPGRFRLANVRHSEDLSALRWTVDTPVDLEFVRAVYRGLSPDGIRRFGMTDVLRLLRERPELATLNAGIRRNEGLERSRAADPVTLRRGREE